MELLGGTVHTSLYCSYKFRVRVRNRSPRALLHSMNLDIIDSRSEAIFSPALPWLLPLANHRARERAGGGDEWRSRREPQVMYSTVHLGSLLIWNAAHAVHLCFAVLCGFCTPRVVSLHRANTRYLRTPSGVRKGRRGAEFTRRRGQAEKTVPLMLNPIGFGDSHVGADAPGACNCQAVVFRKLPADVGCHVQPRAATPPFWKT